MNHLRSQTAVLLLWLIPSALGAQLPADSGMFVVRHKQDTVAVERFTRAGPKLEGTLILKNVKRTTEHYSAVIAPDATIPLIELTIQEGSDTGARPKVMQRARVIFKQDSVAVDEVSNAGLMTRVFATEEGAVPYLNLSFALLEQALRRAQRGAEKTKVAFFNLGGGQTLVASVSAAAGDSLTLDIGDTRYRLKLDSRGRLLGGTIPVQEVIVDRM